MQLTHELSEEKSAKFDRVDHLWPHRKSPCIVYMTKQLQLDLPDRGKKEEHFPIGLSDCFQGCGQWKTLIVKIMLNN